MTKPNAKILAKELFDYQIRLLRGGIADFNGIGDFIANEAKNYQGEDGGLIRFMGAMGGKACLDAHYYWKFRDQINEYQIANNISSISFQEVDWDGYIIRYPFFNDQLTPMPQDKPILMRYKDKLTNWFINFADNYISSQNYKLFYEDDDSYEYRTTLASIQELAKEYEWADITGYTPKITPVYEDVETKKIAYWTRDFAFFLFRGQLHNYEIQCFILRKVWAIEPTELSELIRK